MKVIAAMLFMGLCCLPAFAHPEKGHWCGTKGVEKTELMIKEHEFANRGKLTAAAPLSPHADIGNIAVIKSSSTTLFPPNPFDLIGKKIQFQRTSAGDYTVKAGGGTVSATQGSPLALQDDDTKQVNFTSGFSFPLYGKTYTSVFINSDGNLTFTSGDNASTQRDVLRVLSGPPRLAGFFQDLNPQVRGKVNVLQTATRFTVTWNDVTQYLNAGTNSNTFQINLYKNGNIDFVYGSKVDTKEAVIGLSPGNTTVSNLRLVNYSSVTSLTGVKGAVLENFIRFLTIDFTALINEFHRTHAQIFDFVVVYTDFPINLGGGAFAFFSHTQNNIKGIGIPTFNESSTFGSSKIQGFLAMGALSNYPNDPNVEFLSENSTLEVMGQENGHRWLAYTKVLINGVKTNDLLGRGLGHWSFYMDSDASVMEGNDIRDNGNGTFTTVGANETYSKLDQYMMGLLAPGGVPPFFFVSGGFTDPGRPPQTGVGFSGTRVNVTVQQIIQAVGARVPSSSAAQKKFKEAFILFSKTTTPRQVDLDKIDHIRTAWQAFFHKQTANRGTIDTTLAAP